MYVIERICFECPLRLEIVDFELQIRWNPGREMLDPVDVLRKAFLSHHFGWVGERSVPMTSVEGN